MEGSKDNVLLVQYLEGNLSSQEEQVLQSRLEKEPTLRAEWMVLQEIYTDFERVERVEVPAHVDQTFYQFLEKQEGLAAVPAIRSMLPHWKWVSVAASVAIISALVFSLYLNWTQQQEMADLRAEMEQTQKMLILSMLENPSASDRMQAVGVSLQQASKDDEILQALQQVLDYDPNVNVRLKAASSLAEFVDEPEVIKILLASLEQQSHPQVQIRLIEILTAARKKEALGIFQDMLQQEDIMEIVRNKAAEGIGILL